MITYLGFDDGLKQWEELGKGDLDAIATADLRLAICH